MRIVYALKSIKQLKKLPKKKQISILKKIQILKRTPFLGKRLKGGFKNLHSFKIWPYRIIYQVKNKEKTILIVTIQHRQEVYKKVIVQTHNAKSSL